MRSKNWNFEKIHQTQALTLKNTFSHPLKKKRNLQQCVCSCVSFCPYFHSEIKTFFSNFSRKSCRQRERVRMMWKSCICHVYEWNSTKQSAHSGWIYMRAPTRRKQQNREPGSSKAEGKGKEKQHKMLYTFSTSTVRETFGYVHLRLWKNAFYKYRALVYSRGRQSLYSLSLLFPLFSSFFFSPLYRIKWWIFACPRRLFQKHWADGFEAAASALVLGYYYFLVFLAFVAPKKKKNNTQNQQQRWQMGSCSDCVQCRLCLHVHTSHSQSSSSYKKKWKKKMYKNWNCYVYLRFRVIIFIIPTFHHRLLLQVFFIFHELFLLLRHNMHEILSWRVLQLLLAKLTSKFRKK